MSDPKPWPFTGIDFKVEGGYVLVDDGRKFVATIHETRLWKRLEEVAALESPTPSSLASGARR